MNTERDPTAAVRAVFETYELLEQIMLHLSVRDTLIQQRVSKQWHSVMQRSRPLQKNLYFKANGEPIKPSITYQDVDLFSGSAAYTNTFKLNPMAGMEDCEDGRWSNQKSFAHFALSYTGRLTYLMDRPETRTPFISIVIAVMPFFRGEYRPNTTPIHATHPTASWRRMLLTQPPITAVHLSSPLADEVAIDKTHHHEGLCTI